MLAVYANAVCECLRHVQGIMNAKIDVIILILYSHGLRAQIQEKKSIEVRITVKI